MTASTNASNNTKQAFWVSMGSLFAFGFSIVSSMILSRYFPKVDYGTYKQVIYVYSTFLFIFTLGLPKAFPYYLPRVSIDQAKSLIKKITNLFFFLGGCFSILLFVFSPQIASFLKNPDLELAIKIFSPVPFFMLPTMGLEGILATFHKTQFLTIYTISSTILKLLCVALPVILFHGGYIQAIIGFVIASFISFIIAIYLRYLPVKHAGNERSTISYKEIFRFSLPLLYASLWGIIITSSDQFFISRYFGSAVFADFSNGSLELPFVGMVVGATSMVLEPLFSRQTHEKLSPEKSIFPIWNSVFEKTAKIIYPLILFFWFFADVVMVVLYGVMYENSEIYFRIKLIVNFFTLITYYPLILAIGENKFYANVHFYGAIILVVFEYLSILAFNSPYVVTIVSVVCQIGRIMVLIIFLSNYFNIKFLKLFPIKLIGKIVLPSIIFLLLIRYIFRDLFLMKGVLLLFLSFCSYAILFSVWSYFAKIDYISIVKPLFLKKSE
jgi:O-antigen/teichoic acid export membrane protein